MPQCTFYTRPSLSHTHSAQSRNRSGVQKMSIRINTGNCIEYKTAWWRAQGQYNIVDQRKLFLDAHSECKKKQAKVHFLLQESPPGVTERAIKVPEIFSILGRFGGDTSAPGLCSFVNAFWSKGVSYTKHIWGQIYSSTPFEHVQKINRQWQQSPLKSIL